MSGGVRELDVLHLVTFSLLSLQSLGRVLALNRYLVISQKVFVCIYFWQSPAILILALPLEAISDKPMFMILHFNICLIITRPLARLNLLSLVIEILGLRDTILVCISCLSESKK